MSNKQEIFQLLSQMIEMSEGVDRETHAKAPSLPRGEGFYTFHLKKLRTLLEEEENSDVST